MNQSDYQAVCGPYDLVVAVVTMPTSFLAFLLLAILKDTSSIYFKILIELNVAH